jgi:hypothetical protein
MPPPPSSSSSSSSSSLRHSNFGVGYSLNDYVCKTSEPHICGTAAYLGYPNFSPGLWVGIVLTEPTGLNDGSGIILISYTIATYWYRTGFLNTLLEYNNSCD